MYSNFAERVPLRAALVAAVLTIETSSASAGSGAPRCSAVSAGAAIVDAATMPSAISNAVQRELGALALPREPFNPTDVVEPGKANRRILFVWRKAQRWVVATERGGRGYSNPVLALDLERRTANAKLVAIRTAFPNHLCEVVATLLD